MTNTTTTKATFPVVPLYPCPSWCQVDHATETVWNGADVHMTLHCGVIARFDAITGDGEPCIVEVKINRFDDAQRPGLVGGYVDQSAGIDLTVPGLQMVAEALSRFVDSTQGS